MSKPEVKRIERRLASRQEVEVPDGLLERLKADIPDDFALPSMPAEDPASVRPRKGPWIRDWRLAASVTVLVGAGALLFRLAPQVSRPPGLVSSAPLAAEDSDPSAEGTSDPTAAEGPRAETPARRDAVEPVDSAPAREPASDSLAKETLEESRSEISEEISRFESAVSESEERRSAPRGRRQPAEPAESLLATQEVPKPIDRSAVENRLDRESGREAGEADDSRRLAERLETSDVFFDEVSVQEEAPKVEVGDTSAGSTYRPVDEGMGADRQRALRRKAPVAEPTAPSPPARERLGAVVGYVDVGEASRGSTGGTAEPNDRPYGNVFYGSYGTNPFVDTEDDRLSTFGLDVDTGSYAVARRYLSDGHLPDPESVRVEEFINYLDYGDRHPEGSGEDFRIHAEGAPSPFAEGPRYQLLRFNLSARDVDAEDRPPATLVFVVDTSGSMGKGGRLELVKESLWLLLDQVDSRDRVALVTYGSRGEVVVEPTADLSAIRFALNRLRAEGSTNAEEGLILGYEIARRYFRRGAVNRVILCSDGVANVGRTGPDSILERIGREAVDGIELTTLGFGMGNYNDKLMEQLADRGDGRYAYLDNLDEARRVLVEELMGTLLTVAEEAKVQVEFNPEVVARYRLVGYENRDIADGDFRNDRVDAGEVGAGHTVTALYEIKPTPGALRGANAATLRLRYRSALSGRTLEVAKSVRLEDFADKWSRASPALRLTSVAAEFAEILKGTYWSKEGDLEEVLVRAQRVVADEFAGDPDKAEFVGLVAKAAKLKKEKRRENLDRED